MPSSRAKLARAAALTVAAGAGVLLVRWGLSARKDEDEEEELQAPGMLLLECSQQVKDLLPIAFLVHGAHKASGAGDRERFALIAEQLEIVLLEYCDEVAAGDVDADALEHIAKAMGEGVERSQQLGTLRGAGGCAPFGNICWRLKMAVGGIELGSRGGAAERARLVGLIEAARWQSDPVAAAPNSPFRPPPTPPAAAAPASAAASTTRAFVEAQRLRRTRDEAEIEVLQARARLLSEQAEQMRSMLAVGDVARRSLVRLVAGSEAARGMKPLEFMRRYPLPPDEAERRIALGASGLADGLAAIGEAGCAELDVHLESFVKGDPLGGELLGLMVTLVEVERQTVVVALARAADGTFVSATPRGGFPVIPRKCSNCQHVVAAGGPVCLQGGVRGGGSDEEVGPVLASTPRIVPSLMMCDKTVRAATAAGGYLGQAGRAVAQLKASGRCDDPGWDLAIRTYGNGGNLYTGAPVSVRGVIVGTVCAYTAGAPGGPPAVVEARLARLLEEQAGHISRILERFVDAREARGEKA